MRRGILAKPVSYGRPSRRTLSVLLLLCLAIWAQSSALAFQPGPHHAAEHCCLLCHVGPLPFLQPAVTSTVTPVFLLAGLTDTPEFNPGHQVPLAAASSRAPPIA